MQNRMKGGTVSRRLSERARAASPVAGDTDAAGQGPGALFARLREVVEQLTQTASAAGEPGHAGDAETSSAPGARESGARFTLGGREGRVVFGYTIRTGADGVRAEPFGDVVAEAPAAAPEGAKAPHAKPAPAARAPIVDVFEEAEHVTIIAELPGAADPDVTCTLHGASLRIAATGAHAYEKTIALPPGLDPASLTQTLRNGILEVRLTRQAAP